MAVQVPGGALGEATLYMIVGGLFMLSLVLVLVLLRSLFPVRPSPQHAGAPVTLTRTMAPVPDLRRAAEVLPTLTPQLPMSMRVPAHLPTQVRSIDDVVEVAGRRGLGNVRILRVSNQTTVVRVYGCQECARSYRNACPSTAAFLRDAFSYLARASVRVQETVCRPGACEFEVSE